MMIDTSHWIAVYEVSGMRWEYKLATHLKRFEAFLSNVYTVVSIPLSFGKWFKIGIFL